MPTRTTALVFLFCGFLSLSTVQGAPDSWTVEVGMGGAIVPGVWTPLRVSVPVDAGPWELEIRAISASGRESKPVTYQHSVGGAFEDPLFLADATRALTLRFLSVGVVREEFSLSLGERLFPGHLIGVDGLDPEVQANLSEILLPQEPVRVMGIAPAVWPISPLSYGGVSSLVLQDPGPVLSPAQVVAVKAWVGSGGRLVVTNPREASRSLLAQIGDKAGLGRIEAVNHPDQADWKTLLDLKPYGQVRRLGTDFDPPARNLPVQDSALSPVSIGFLLLWAGLAALLLVLRRKKGLGAPLALAGVGSATVLILWAAGVLAWDRGLPVHGREAVLPGNLGRFASVEAMRSSARSGPLDWFEASPWALDLWKKGLPTANALVRSTGPDKIAFDAFLPALVRQTPYKMHWDGRGVRWTELREGSWVDRENMPAEFTSDGPWLSKIASSFPGVVWSAGISGTTCWVQPVVLGGRS